jgi:hypothetical protein
MPEQAALIAVVILERPMCLDCVASRTNLPPSHVKVYLDAIARSLKLVLAERRCHVCGETRATFSLTKP